MSEKTDGFPLFNRILAQADLMDRMMERMDADPLVAIRRDGGATFYDARSRCIDCAADRQCRNWLDAAPSTEPQVVPTFCVNSDFIKSCREEASDNPLVPLAPPGTPKG
jgi:hypothetical protein